MANPVAMTYPTVAARLKTVLTAATSAEIVMRGGLLDRVQNDAIMISGTEDGEIIYRVMKAGRKPRQETYELIINVWAAREGEEPTDAEERAFALVQEIDDAIADDPAIGLGVGGTETHNSLVINVGEFESDSFYDEQTRGWRCRVILKLFVQCRLD